MSHRSRTLMTVAAAMSVLFAAGANVAAQDSARSAETFCFRARLRSDCKWFAMTELGVDFNVIGKPVNFTRVSVYTGERYSIEWKPTNIAINGALGVMRNIGGRNAIGGELTAIPGSQGPLFGVKARYRRWLTADLWAFDAAAGVVAGTDDLAIRNEAPPGFSADIALSYNTYFGVTARYEMLRGNGKPKPLLYTGVKVGGFSAWGIAALLATGAVIALGAAGGGD
ncbi:MAG: hypothetical protein ABJB74_04650 [Gemmatimonas sp.]